MGLYELNEKLTLARQRGFKFNQINKLTIKNYCSLSTTSNSNVSSSVFQKNISKS